MARQRKTLSILLIPDGDRQTFTFKIRYYLVRLVIAFLLIFCGLLVFGTVSYWKLAEIALDYKRVQTLNQKLLRDNSRINQIAESLRRIQETDKRIKSIFGDKIDFPEAAGGESAGQMSAGAAGYPSPLNRESATSQPGAEGRVDIVTSYPTLTPVDGIISRNFDHSEIYKGSLHSGIDISAKEFSVIRAAGAGVVIFANWTLYGGYQVIIDHQNGYMTVYKHNASLMVIERQYVNQGDAIALLGNSGVSTAPHLHFEIWKNFKPVDPFTILALNKTEPLHVRN